LLIKWVNKRITFEDAVKKLEKLEKKFEECRKELQLIRYHMQLR